MSELAPEQVEPTQVEGAEVEAPAETWAGPSQEEWQQVQETNQLIQQALQQPAQQEYPQYQQPTVDPLSDDFQQQLDQYLEQKFAPYASYQEQLVMGEATERAKDIIHSLEQEKGEFLDPGLTDLALERANNYSAEAMQRFGNTPKAAEYALQRAYDDIKQLQDAVGKQYYERQVNQIRGLSNAPREPQQSGLQAGQQVTVGAGDEFDVVGRFFQQNR